MIDKPMKQRWKIVHLKIKLETCLSWLFQISTKHNSIMTKLYIQKDVLGVLIRTVFDKLGQTLVKSGYHDPYILIANNTRIAVNKSTSFCVQSTSQIVLSNDKDPSYPTCSLVQFVLLSEFTSTKSCWLAFKLLARIAIRF